MRKVDFIVIHHTVTHRDARVEQIRQAHLNKGWSDIGYHFLIDGNAYGHEGRPEKKIGAHCKGHNTKSLGLAFIGYYHQPMNDVLSQAQITAAIEKITEWCKKYGIKPDAIYPHSKFMATACPGDGVRKYLPRIIAGVRAKLKGGK